MKGAFGSSAATAKEKVTIPTLRLTTAEGPVEFKNIQLYLREKPDDLFSAYRSQVELVLTSNSHLSEHTAGLDGQNFDLNDGV